MEWSSTAASSSTREGWGKVWNTSWSHDIKKPSTSKKESMTPLPWFLKGHISSEKSMPIGPTYSTPLVNSPNGQIPTAVSELLFASIWHVSPTALSLPNCNFYVSILRITTFPLLKEFRNSECLTTWYSIYNPLRRVSLLL